MAIEKDGIPMKSFALEERTIGDGTPVFIIAEVGINHNGDMELARKHIEAAHRAGADAVKFQNYRTEDFLSDDSLEYTYSNQGQEITESQFAMFKRCELSRDDLKMLAAYSKELGLQFVSTPTNAAGVADLVETNAVMLKNGSDYLQHLPLIEVMAKTGLPTVLSVGMANLAEIDDAVRAYRDAGGEKLALLHCTSSYPTPQDDVHLRKIQTLQDAFGCPIGFSDHSEGIVACLGAVALGACILEKHFTLNKNLPGPDHEFSMDEAELLELVTSVRLLERSFGDREIGPTAKELTVRDSYRLSCVASKDLQKGHLIKKEDIAFRRPGNGLPPKSAKQLTGLTLTTACLQGEPLKMENFH